MQTINIKTIRGGYFDTSFSTFEQTLAQRLAAVTGKNVVLNGPGKPNCILYIKTPCGGAIYNLDGHITRELTKLRRTRVPVIFTALVYGDRIDNVHMTVAGDEKPLTFLYTCNGLADVVYRKQGACDVSLQNYINDASLATMRRLVSA